MGKSREWPTITATLFLCYYRCVGRSLIGKTAGVLPEREQATAEAGSIPKGSVRSQHDVLAARDIIHSKPHILYLPSGVLPGT